MLDVVDQLLLSLHTIVVTSLYIIILQRYKVYIIIIVQFIFALKFSISTSFFLMTSSVGGSTVKIRIWEEKCHMSFKLEYL